MKRLKIHEAQPKKKILRITKLLAIVFGVVLVLEVWMVNRLSTYGTKIEELKAIEANLQLENQVLENTIAQKASLKQVELKAVLLGFSSIKNLEYVTFPELALTNK